MRVRVRVRARGGGYDSDNVVELGGVEGVCGRRGGGLVQIVFACAEMRERGDLREDADVASSVCTAVTRVHPRESVKKRASTPV